MRFLICPRIKWLQTWAWNPETSFSWLWEASKFQKHSNPVSSSDPSHFYKELDRDLEHCSFSKTVVLCHCLWAGWGSYPDLLQVTQDPRVVWRYTWLGSSQERWRLFGSEDSNRHLWCPQPFLFMMEELLIYLMCIQQTKNITIKSL